MDPPPLPPLPTTPTPPAAATNIPSATSMNINYPGSVDSSPRSRTTDTYDHEPLPPLPGGSKLRLMCSYGGHIMPRPHDKVLCYVGGETRLVVVDRHASLSVLCARLSRTLLHGRPFLLKYQLPNEELDNLVTVTMDEDLENLIEEYDRIVAQSSNSAGSPRIRLFLFFNKPETAASMGALLADAKSETWFVDALNGSMLLPRGLSDSAMDQCLVNLDGDVEAQVEGGGGPGEEIKPVKNDAVSALNQEMQHSVPDSENASSFGSTSSMQSMANLPPIRVRVDEGGSGRIEEQLAQISFVGGAGNMYKQVDGFGAAAALPPRAVVTTMATAAPVAAIYPAGGSNENLNRILSDDERSDQGAPTGFRRPPLPLQPVQHKPSGGYNLPSPDSVASDASASSISRPMYHQEQVHVVSNPNNNLDASISSPQVQTQQVQDSGYELSQHSDQQLKQQQQHKLQQHLDQQQQQQQQQHMMQQHSDQQQQQQQQNMLQQHSDQQHFMQQQQAQQQFVHPSMHYIPHPAAAPVPMPSYYQVYAPPSQQQQHQHPHPVDQQYPVYVMPVGAQPQPYMTMQPNMSDGIALANPSMAPGMAHKDAIPPIYATKPVPVTTVQHEMAAGAYRAAPNSAGQMVQVPSNQQYPSFPQMHHPSQSPNYGYEYAKNTHDQMYYAQHQATSLPPQYQTMSRAAAAAAIADASKEMPADNNTKQQ